MGTGSYLWSFPTPAISPVYLPERTKQLVEGVNVALTSRNQSLGMHLRRKLSRVRLRCGDRVPSDRTPSQPLPQARKCLATSILKSAEANLVTGNGLKQLAEGLLPRVKWECGAAKCRRKLTSRVRFVGKEPDGSALGTCRPTIDDWRPAWLDRLVF